jgi:glucose-1-phosphate adenylyltransferase
VALPYSTINRGARLRTWCSTAASTFPPGLVVGEDPEEDAKRFRVSENGVTLITQPMIDRLGL